MTENRDEIDIVKVNTNAKATNKDNINNNNHNGEQIELSESISISSSVKNRPKLRRKLNIRILILFLLIFIYIFLGGLMFWLVEDQYGKDKCDTIVDETKAKIQNFIDDHVKPEFEIYKQEITKDVNYQANFTNILEKITNFNDFQISMTNNKTFEPSCFSTDNYANSWNLKNSMFFSLTIITTIGYGSKTPWSPLGKLLVVPYAIVGFSLFGALVIALTKRFRVLTDDFAHFLITITPGIKNHRTRSNMVRKYKNELVSICVVISELFIPAIIFVIVEDWNFLEAIYYV